MISMNATTTSTVRPVVHDGAHSIETTRYLLPTPSIMGCKDFLRQCIDNRATGATIYGPPRYGKSKAILYLSMVLAEDFGTNVPIIRMLCHDKFPSETVFFGDLLRAAGHALCEKGTGASKRNRLLEYAVEMVEESKQNRLIIFLDEAQRLHERQYNWLIDFHNELDAKEVSAIVLLVGQPDLMDQLTAFQAGKKMQIIGRFMVHRYRFHGLQDAEDIRMCLDGYDTNSEYPAGSGVSFTRYYYPAGFEQGFRLASYADELWEAFRQTREEASLPGSKEIPMQYFCRTVEYALKHFGTLEVLTSHLSIAQWKEAIGVSGYADAERYICDPIE